MSLKLVSLNLGHMSLRDMWLCVCEVYSVSYMYCVFSGLETLHYTVNDVKASH